MKYHLISHKITPRTGLLQCCGAFLLLLSPECVYLLLMQCLLCFFQLVTITQQMPSFLTCCEHTMQTMRTKEPRLLLAFRKCYAANPLPRHQAQIPNIPPRYHLPLNSRLWYNQCYLTTSIITRTVTHQQRFSSPPQAAGLTYRLVSSINSSLYTPLLQQQLQLNIVLLNPLCRITNHTNRWVGLR